MFNLIAELVIPVGIPTKEAKPEMKKYPINTKYPHITESYACILEIFLIIFLFPMNFLISF